MELTNEAVPKIKTKKFNLMAQIIRLGKASPGNISMTREKKKHIKKKILGDKA